MVAAAAKGQRKGAARPMNRRALAKPAAGVVLAAVSLLAFDAYSSPLFRAGVHTTSPPISGWDLVSADFDEDGIADFAFMGTAHLTTWRGLGDGTLAKLDSTYADGYRVEADDLDGDGAVDLIYTYGSSLAIRLGNGDGTFDPPVQYPFPPAPRALGPAGEQPEIAADGSDGIAIAELTGDAYLDVAVATGATGVLVFPGVGGGVLGTAVDIGGSGGDVAAADLDGDGDTDLATSTGSELQLRFQQAGSFQAPVTYPTAGYGVAVGDLNGGPMDIVCGRDFFSGLGGGSYAPGVPITSGSEIGPTLADFDEDGALDVATLSNDTQGIVIHLGAGDGTFSTSTPIPTGMSPQALVTGDWNGDGHADLAVATYTNATIATHPGNGDGTFGRRLDYPIAPGSDVEIAELTGDGIPDVLTSAPLMLWPGMGDGRMEPAIDLTIAALGIATGDFDGDGNRDIATANGAVNSISLLRGLGGGAFAPPVSYGVGGNALLIGARDLDGNGRDDVVVHAGTTISVFKGQANGTLALDHTRGAISATEMSVVEATGDSHPDVVLLRNSGEPNTPVQIFSGSATGTLGAGSSFDYAGLTVRTVAVGDFTSDGIPDLAGAGQSRVYLRAGTGGGAFASPVHLERGLRVEAARAADVNADGHLDLVTAASIPMHCSVYLGNGAGGLVLEGGYGIGGVGHELEVADLNGNGRPEIVAITKDVFGAGAPENLCVLRDATTPVGSVSMEPPAPLSLERFWPQPSRGTLSYALTLSERARVRLDVLDVSGRRVHRGDLGELEPGTHSNQLRLPASLPNGLYWLRMTQGTHSAMGKVLLVR